jgi:hypothetical protein
LYELTAYKHFDLGLAVIGTFAACLVSCVLGWWSFKTTVSGLAASYLSTLLVLFWLGALAYFLLFFSSPMNVAG